LEPEPTPTAIPPPRFCPRCGDALDPVLAACARCAAPRAELAALADAPAAQASLRRALVLYFALLLVNLVILATRSGSAQTLLVADVVATLLVVAFVVGARQSLLPVLRQTGRPIHYLAAGLCVAVTYPLAALAVGALHRWFGVEELDYLGEFAEAGLGLPIALLSVCVQPAIVEELAFRGVILGSFASFLGGASAVLLSSVLFAILHLSIPSFPHLFILGGMLGLLRMRTGSLYPGMLLHFGHNLCVILVELSGS
jgi:membrane protease YdiL (CAAX protease family)